MSRPTLWHLRDSHFNEKARWALDHKQVPHVRRAPPPGVHMLVALILTGRPTLPVLVLDGRRIRDSAAIVAAVDDRPSRPRLIAADPVERRREQSIEALCADELGPCLRRFSLFHLLQDARLCAAMTAPAADSLAHAALRATVPGLRRLLFARYRVTAQSAADARVRAVAALNRLEAELAGQQHFVGGRFTVADLTVAAMLGPLLRPAGSSWAPMPWLPPAVAELKAEVERRPIGAWALTTYADHR